MVEAKATRRLTYERGWLAIRPVLGWELRTSRFFELAVSARLGAAAAVVAGRANFERLLSTLESVSTHQRNGLEEARRHFERDTLEADDICRLGVALERTYVSPGSNVDGQVALMFWACGLEPIASRSHNPADLLAHLAPGEAFVARVSISPWGFSAGELVLVFREPNGRLGLYRCERSGEPLLRIERPQFAELLTHRLAQAPLGAKFRFATATG